MIQINISCEFCDLFIKTLSNTCERLLLNIIILWIFNCRKKYTFSKQAGEIYLVFQVFHLFWPRFKIAALFQISNLVNCGPLWTKPVKLFGSCGSFILLKNCCERSPWLGLEHPLNGDKIYYWNFMWYCVSQVFNVKVQHIFLKSLVLQYT